MEYKVHGIKFQKEKEDTLVEIRQGGVDCVYKRKPTPFHKPVRYVRMDLDGTSVKSEEFWISRIEKTRQVVSQNSSFRLTKEDFPFVSGFTTQEHLSYCLSKYKIPVSVNRALEKYHELTKEELSDILSGKKKTDAFRPREGLKDFLLFLKGKNIKIGLATSGLDYKARGEIESAFSLLGLVKPTDFYDSIVTGGREKKKGRYGTRGELVSKPHPWIYSELALGLSIEDPSNAVVMEDSSAGVISARLAGFNVIGFKDGNIYPSGLNDQCVLMADGFDEIKEFIQ